MISLKKSIGVLPGFGINMGLTLFLLSAVILFPLSTLFLKTASLSSQEFWSTLANPRVMAAFRLSFSLSLGAAAINSVFGFLTAWILVRYSFPLRNLIDGLIDLPFALPTAVAGITLTTLTAPHGWLGQPLAKMGVKIAFTPLGILMALVFIGLPFVVRTVQPVLEDFEREMEEAAGTLGANRWQTFWRIIFPIILPSLLTGFTLALARALGEYGTVVFISGNIPMKTEVLPLLIMTKLEQFDYSGATTIAVFMLGASFGLILITNLIQRWSRSRQGTSL